MGTDFDVLTATSSGLSRITACRARLVSIDLDAKPRFAPPESETDRTFTS